MTNQEEIIELLETLTGQNAEKSSMYDCLNFEGRELKWGLSQLNEVLLLLRLDRVNNDFFYFLLPESEKKKMAPTIITIDDLKNGVLKFIEISLLLFGNVRFAFKTMSNDSIELNKALELIKPSEISFLKLRHTPILKIEKIRADQTYYLGYIIQAEIQDMLSKDSANPKAIEEQGKMLDIIDKGKRNQEAYLVSDHMDIYVATSMRQRHEFLLVSRLADEIFSHELLKDLNLRYFDPTQAYCEDRIDKGLSEGLMLKRARCTIYLAQESETLGKDSELATTLAQGKPVIAYIPNGTEDYVEKLIEDLMKLEPLKLKKEIILKQLSIFAPDLAWNHPTMLNENEDTLKEKFKQIVETYYDKRANNLSKSHPLGLQVNLNTGVANGVLVVRTIDECVKLLYKIFTNSLEFRCLRKNLRKEFIGC